MTAQTLLKELCRDTIGPLLRSRGYKGSGRRWRRITDDKHVLIVEVQANRHSTRDAVEFRLNLYALPYVVLLHAYQGSDLPDLNKVTGGTGPGTFGCYLPLTGEVGSVEPNPIVGWWSLSQESVDVATSDVVQCLTTTALPWVERLASVSGAIGYAQGKAFPDARSRQLFPLVLLLAHARRLEEMEAVSQQLLADAGQDERRIARAEAVTAWAHQHARRD